MLDEEEFAAIADLYSKSMTDVRPFREYLGADRKHPNIGELFRPVREKYEQLTGFKETNANAIMHHRLSLYGVPCRHCGKPLGTPSARFCGNCMLPVDPPIPPPDPKSPVGA